MHSAVQTAVVTIISYKPLSGLNFARYTGQYGSYIPSSPLGVYKPLLVYMDWPTLVHAVLSLFYCHACKCIPTSFHNGI